MTMLCILEITKERDTAISLLNAEGIITHSVPLATMYPVTDQEEATKSAETIGWQPYGLWTIDGDYQWVQVVPKPLTIAFASSEISDQMAVDLAKNVGYSVNEVVKQTYIPEDGKTYIAFSVDVPNGWDWGHNLLGYEDEPI